MRAHIEPLFLIILSLSLLSCGYHFAGTGNLPANIKTIAIEVLKNRTNEVGVENRFTNDIIYEITRNEKVTLTNSKRAEAILSGVIKSVEDDTIAHTEAYTSEQRRIEFVFDLTLKNKEGVTIWSAIDIYSNETYDVSDDRTVTDQNQDEAITKLSERFAEKVYGRLTEDF